MPSIQAIGGKSFVVPLLDVDIDLEADDAEERVRANWDELQAAFAMAGRFDGDFEGNNGTVLLPAGTIYATGPDNTGLSNIMLDERHAGITIQGAGRAKTLLVDPYRGVPQIQINSRRISYVTGGPFTKDITAFTGIASGALNDFEVGDLAYFWTFNNGNARSTRELRTITAVNSTAGTLSIDSALTVTANAVKDVKGAKVSGAVAAGSTQLTLANSGDLTRFKINDDVMIGDGPAINEFYGEWATVTGFHQTLPIVYFTPPLRQDYASGLTCIVPPPHLTDVTLRDFAVAAPRNNEARYVGYIRVGRRIQLENFAIVPDGTDATAPGVLNVVNCGRWTASHCIFGQPSFNADHDVVMTDVSAIGIGGEEWCFDFYCSNIFTNGGGFLFVESVGDAGAGPCQRIHLRDSLLLNHGNDAVRFVEGSVVSNVRLIRDPTAAVVPIYLNDPDVTLDGFSTDSELVLHGPNTRLSNLRVAALTWDAPTGFADGSGVLSNPLPDGLPKDTTAIGEWKQPLLVNRDGSTRPPQTKDGSGTTRTPGLVLPSPAPGTVPLTVRADGSQTGSLQEWQDSDGTTIYTLIDKSGYIMTRKIAAPADGDVHTSELAVWFDNTNGAGKLMIKARTANNTVVTGSVALS